MQKFNLIWEKYGTFGILLLITLGLGIGSPQYFLTTSNLTQVLLQSAVTILIGVGEFFTILIAGIDLSVGSIMALTGMISAKMMIAGVPWPVAILIGGVVVGGTLGCFNGFLVNKTGLHPFIITLGTLAIYRGLTLIISEAAPVFGLPQGFKSGIAGWLGPVPIPVLIALIVALVFIFITVKTKLGRNIYALGGNSQAAWFSGINIKRHTLIVFVISGICAGIAGVVLTARLGAAEPLAGTGYETQAIAAAIIGGTSFFGGKGRVIGVVMGGLIIGVINNGLNILSVPTYYQQIVMGGLIILAVFLDRLFGSKKLAA
ncbi:D-allose ABC transporter permease [Paenibacillus kribbensis]|uniref:Allose ABC transporter n=1 Tax=Paenibacillus kribbensis TaxID=172713 RepID=A0A222WNQ9_9BACL|nr:MULTISPECIES: D-allose ABC transporter permease [Paenibacillus]ASR47756.1 allose ABC transporter [Paenibacillus kribbensis]EHS57779.1 D-allose transporter subunit [Paenibacillus sp. Aloe-11]MEC0236543.1 D-allose ABC transporter permease [Paenibacillus kribbensis]